MEQAWLIPVYGFLAFGVLALFRRYLPGQGKYLSILAVVAGFVTFWPVLFDMVGQGVDSYHFPRVWFSAGSLDVGSGMIIDPLTVAMLALVTFVSVIVQVYSLEYMRHDGHDDRRIGWYYAAHSLFTASMLTLVLADNLLVLYVAWELVGLCSYLLIGFWYERRSAAEAAKKAFITTRLGDVGLLIGILLLVVEFGTFDISTILEHAGDADVNGAVVTGSAFLIFLGAMGKSAQFPLHVWLPDAMEGPTPVSALIHAATMVTAGVFLVARMLPLFEAADGALTFVAIIGIVTALAGAVLATASYEFKRILAYSTMSHLGFMMLALGAGALTPAIFHLLMHGAVKSMLFLSAGSVMHAMHDEADIRNMGGLAKRMPITTIAFIIGALALAGIPPLAAFWSKDEILAAVATTEGFSPIYLALFLIAIVLSAFYMARAIRVVFLGPLSKKSQEAHETPFLMSGLLALLAVIAVVAGFIALPLGGGYDGIGSFIFDPHHGEGHGFEFNALWALTGTALALVGLGVGWWFYQDSLKRENRLKDRFPHIHAFLIGRFYIDRLYQWIIDRIVLGLGRAVALFDRRGVNDVGVNGPGLLTLEAGRRLRAHVTGLFADYGLAMVAGVAAITLFLWLRV